MKQLSPKTKQNKTHSNQPKTALIQGKTMSGHLPNKAFGQNFLNNSATISSIIREIGLKVDDVVVEIGPGLGALTLPLLEQLQTLTVIELDPKLVARWQQHTKVQVIAKNVLQVDFNALNLNLQATLNPENLKDKQTLRLVGNLPYHISSDLLMHCLQAQHSITDQHFMLQKEVIDRMLASPGNKAYGRLSVIMQANYAMEHVLDVDAQDFFPPPKVQSAVIRMRPLKQYSLAFNECLGEVTRTCFSQRRKMLRHIYKHATPNLLKAFDWGVKELNLNLEDRAEAISVANYCALANYLYTIQNSI